MLGWLFGKGIEQHIPVIDKSERRDGTSYKAEFRYVHAAARDTARRTLTTDAYVNTRRRRKRVEVLFAHLKRILQIDRLRLHEPNGTKDTFRLAATAQIFRIS